jgi:hypothetical protein
LLIGVAALRGVKLLTVRAVAMWNTWRSQQQRQQEEAEEQQVVVLCAS